MVVRRFHTLAGMMGQSAAGRTRRGERSWPKWRSLNLVQKVFGFCTATPGTKTDESMHAGEYVYGKMIPRILTLQEGRVPAKSREDGKRKSEEERSPRRSAKGFGRSLRWEVSWRSMGCGTSPKANTVVWDVEALKRSGCQGGARAQGRWETTSTTS